MAVSILLVDDDEAFRSLAVSMLRAGGHDHVHEAGTAAGALTVADAVRPDVALVDVGLPDGDGLQLADQLAHLSNPPRVVLISADATATDSHAAGRAGAVAFVAKEQLTPARLHRLIDVP
jgi:CheY-like chemotaxis protein